jgi:membrane-bound ClpP family serine protease
MPDSSTQPKQPPIGLSPGFASSQGANILLAMGVVLFLIGCAALAIGHATIAAVFIPVGLFTVTIAARLGGLALVTFEVVKVKASATFKSEANDDSHGSGDYSDS